MPTVALLTDFGLRDAYVGVMKGVVLSVCADATLVDITHDIAPQDVAGAAFELAAAYRYFPAATVFLCVVDPGVGSGRRAIAAAAAGYYFVGPDNGILSLVFREAPPSAMVELRERKYARSTISRTFEGRDRFAPAAGWLARGVDLHAFGPAVADPVVLEHSEPVALDSAVEGAVVHVDRFGNLITNVTEALVQRADRAAIVEVGGQCVPVVGTYSDVRAGELCALIGSAGLLEIAVNGGSAAAMLGGGVGTVVRVRPQD